MITIDPERWPQQVREFVDSLGVAQEGVQIAVEYSEPVWVITATCPCCHIGKIFAVSGLEPLPVPAAASGLTPVPDWVRSLW